ncbi:20437_t:CDS:1, partial [Cetraspora pellucida]
KVSKKNPSKKKISPNNACRIGWCNDEEKLNICQAKRPIGTQITRIEFGSKKENNHTFYFDTLYQRILPFRLFQTKKFEPFTRFTLHDILIHLQIITYHNRDKTRTIRIPTPAGTTIITPLISQMIIRSYILEICDRELLKKKNINFFLDDLLMDKDFQNIEFNTKKVKPLLEDIQEIDCSLCNFSENEIIMCLDLSKMQVCLSTGKTDTESAVFDKGNYLFVMFLDYCNFMYNFKKNTLNVESNTYFLGKNYDFNNGNSGIPSFTGKGYIESAWTPRLQGQDYQRIMAKMANCCDEKEA